MQDPSSNPLSAGLSAGEHEGAAGDAFSLLGLEPRAALTTEQVERAFGERAERCHPDAGDAAADGNRFAALGAARDRLVSVAGRLDELLRLEAGAGADGGRVSAGERRTVALSAELNRLFPVVGGALDGAREAIGRRDRAGSDLARALVVPALLAARTRLVEAQQQVRAVLAGLEDGLAGLDRELAAADDGRRQRARGELAALQGQFACLERWLDQLRQQTAACMF